jgi:uncharacterized protein
MGKKMDKDTNAINWFEIPATDLARATKFYETIFDIKMVPMEMENIKMAMFPPDGSSGKIGGALAQSGMHKPSSTGVLVYLNANPEMQLVIDRIEKAGGKVIMGKTQISPEIGYMGFFGDTEGNTVALHSNG